MSFKVSDPFIMIVNRYSQTLFRRILLDNIIVEFSLDLCRLRKPVRFLLSGIGVAFLFDHGFCQIDTFITDINVRTDNDFTDLRISLAAK